MQNPNEDTEWNDVLRQKGILPARNNEVEITESAIEAMVDGTVKQYTQDALTKDIEFNELEDLEDELEEQIFLEYRRKRLEELKTAVKKNKYGEVLEITGQEYVKEVNQAGEDVWVVLHLYRPGVPTCTLINNFLPQMAQQYPAVKFIKSLAQLCIPNYPDQNLPTIFIYKNGEMKSQYVGQQLFQGLNYKGLEQLLAKSGVIETEETSHKKLKDALFSELLGQQ